MKLIGIFRKSGKPSASTKAHKNKSGGKERIKMSTEIADGRLGIKPQEAKRHFEKVVNNNMSEREIKVLNDTGGVHLVVKKIRGGNDAEYCGVVNGKHRIEIKPDAITNEEVGTHEMVHALQEVDDKRPELDRKLSIRNLLRPNSLGLKEALTEAETVARVQKVNYESIPFYDRVDKKLTLEEMKREDRMTLTNKTDKAQGERSVSLVRKHFNKLNIADYKDENGTKTAKEVFAKQKNTRKK